MDISCRQFHNEKRHCTQKHLFFSCTLTILLGALYLWPFMNEWMTVHGVTLCCVPRWLLSLLQQCLLQCGLWCQGQVLHLSVLVMEQQVMTTLHEGRSSHCCQRTLHASRRQKPLWHGFPLYLWVWKHARAVGILWKAVPGQGSPVWCSSHQRVCRICVLMLSCVVPWFSSNGMVWFMQCTA